MRLRNRVAIITGAGAGLGRAMALRLAAEGAAIVVVDCRDDAAAETANELQRRGATALGLGVDVTDPAATRQMSAKTIATFGRIDILVNNAGVSRRRRYAEMTDADWNGVLAVNTKGVFFCIQAVADHMIEARSGKIVNISSSGGTGAGGHHKPEHSWAGNANYQASKATVIQMTRTFARELGSYGINVNCIAPGVLNSSMTTSTRTEQEKAEHIAALEKLNVMRRAGSPEEIANAALFLACDDSSFMSGQLLNVDGGITDRM